MSRKAIILLFVIMLLVPFVTIESGGSTNYIYDDLHQLTRIEGTDGTITDYDDDGDGDVDGMDLAFFIEDFGSDGDVDEIDLSLFAEDFGRSINGEILQQDLDADGNGYTVLKVWGTYEEMGYAYGYLLADDIDSTIGSLKRFVDSKFRSEFYDDLKQQMQNTVIPSDVTDEVDGIVEGVRARISSDIESGDIIMFNTYPDWLASPYCRSHSCWGSYVTSPVKTLSTRRTDYSGAAVASLFDSINILFIVYDPSESGELRWANLAMPGLVIGGTAVNEYGILVSLHDSPDHGGSHATGSNVITRSIASRYMITDVLLQSLQVGDIFIALQAYKVWTGGFINYYAPEGNAGVFSLSASDGFYYLRKPQLDYYGGNVIITSNLYTDGSYTPSDFQFPSEDIDAYYSNTAPKTLASHWGFLDKVGTSLGAQQMSVAYRGHEDMTIWVRGRLFGIDRTPIIKLEWSDLFSVSPP